MNLKNRLTQAGALEPVIIAETDEGVIFIPGLTSILTVGSHQGPVPVEATERTIVKPATATHLQLQTIAQNIRYTIDDSEATATHGFQLSAGAISTIPVPGSSIRIFREGSGANLQYQWLKAR